MLYFLHTYSNNAEAADGMVIAESTKEWTNDQRRSAITRNDLVSFDDAKALAASANRLTEEGKYLAIDNGHGVYPRWDVIEAPQVGHEVSYGFNGDYYPCGKITKISKSLHMITTDTGEKFYRRGETAKWVMSGTWTMVRGHRSERNPSF